MRLITWNCKGAFHRKRPQIESLRPDILVVQETRELSLVASSTDGAAISSYDWIGDESKKGLGVIAYGDYRVERHDAYVDSLRWILPLKVTGPTEFTLFAVWTLPHPQTRFYITCLFEMCDVYESLLSAGRIVVAGDLNQNVVFDRPRSKFKYSHLIEKLAGFGLESLYHKQYGCEQGKEPDPTFFLWHRAERPMHLDHVFATEDVHRENFDIRVGGHETWHKLSDHMPLTCDFNG